MGESSRFTGDTSVTTIDYESGRGTAQYYTTKLSQQRPNMAAPIHRDTARENLWVVTVSSVRIGSRSWGLKHCPIRPKIISFFCFSSVRLRLLMHTKWSVRTTACNGDRIPEARPLPGTRSLDKKKPHMASKSQQVPWQHEGCQRRIHLNAQHNTTDYVLTKITDTPEVGCTENWPFARRQWLRPLGRAK